MENNIEKRDADVIDLSKVISKLLRNKKTFLIVWGFVFILSCIWIFPQPRYYNSSVSLAPEATEENFGGGLSSLTSNFGFDIGGGSTDAIYPLLYPELIESNEFIVNILDVKVKTSDNSINTDYYTYMSKYQKKNQLTAPFLKIIGAIKKWFTPSKTIVSEPTKGKGIDPFKLSEYDYNLVETIKEKIKCDVDKKTDVITITVKDQDPLVCATLADSVRQHLQDFIIDYRTSKARLDVSHYQHLADSARIEYDLSLKKYSAYCDANQDIILQSSISERDKLESDMQFKYNTYTAMCTQLEAMKSKLQERTPAFTTLKCATVPIKPAGPKRMLFVIGMLILATIVTSIWIARKEITGNMPQ